MILRYEAPDIGAVMTAAYDLLAQDAKTKEALDSGDMRFGIVPLRVDQSGIITLKAWFACTLPGEGDELCRDERIEKVVKYLPCGDGSAVLDGRVMMEGDVVTALLNMVMSMGNALAAEIVAKR